MTQWKWHFDGRHARRHYPLLNGKQGNILMHRLIAKTPRGKFTDHIDGNELNNQESNLRLCNFRQNAANQKKRQNLSSVYKGVTKDQNRWRTQIWADNSNVYDATFHNERWAAMAYDLNAAALFGEYARLNFPEAILTVQE